MPQKILGYPALAMVLFLLAAGAGFWLLLTIFVSDERRSRKGS